jgi:hypothetical protein
MPGATTWCQDATLASCDSAQAGEPFGALVLHEAAQVSRTMLHAGHHGDNGFTPRTLAATRAALVRSPRNFTHLFENGGGPVLDV